MAHQIMKAPDGTYFIWSTVVEDVIFYNANERELLEYYKQEYGNRGAEHLKQIIKSLKLGEKPYGKYTMTFEEAMDQRTWNKSEEQLNEDKEYCEWIQKQWSILNQTK